MTVPNTSFRNGKATTIKTTFHRETSVCIDIRAHRSIIWRLLTTAENYPRWNPTIISIKGAISPGEKIKLKSTLDPKRTFKLTIKEFEKEQRLVWGDGQGERIFTLTNDANGMCTFTMDERIGGWMFPLYARYIPPFDDAFEKFAAGLKKEAETINNL